MLQAVFIDGTPLSFGMVQPLPLGNLVVLTLRPLALRSTTLHRFILDRIGREGVRLMCSVGGEGVGLVGSVGGREGLGLTCSVARFFVRTPCLQDQLGELAELMVETVESTVNVVKSIIDIIKPTVEMGL
jgi:hypothetical protein